MADNVKVRPYSDRDYAQFRRLLGSSYEIYDTRDRMRAKVDRDPKSVLVALVSRRIVGAAFFVDDGRSAVLTRIITADDLGAFEIARKLVEGVEAELASRGHTEYQTIFPISWDELTLHRDLGFGNESQSLYSMDKEITLPIRSRR